MSRTSSYLSGGGKSESRDGHYSVNCSRGMSKEYVFDDISGWYQCPINLCGIRVLYSFNHELNLRNLKTSRHFS